MLLASNGISARSRNGRTPANAHRGPAVLELMGDGFEWMEAAAGDDAKLKRFTMVAYTGAAMRIAGWPYPVVVNLKGLKIPSGSLPVLKNHDRDQIVGHTDKTDKQEARLTLQGVISGTGDAAREVVETSANKFPWQASVGAHLEDMIFVPSGATVKANGKEFKGPVYVARKATLGEVSFVPVGGDLRTSAKVAAAGDTGKESTMNFNEWLQAKGFDPEAISEDQRKFLQAAFDAENTATAEAQAAAAAQAAAGAGGGGEATPDSLVAAGAPTNGISRDEAQKLYSDAVETERKRVSDIEGACAGFKTDEANELRASAMRGDIDLVSLQARLLGIVREGRPTGLAASGGGSTGESDRNTLLAVAYRAGDIPEAEIIAACGEQSIDAAYTLRGMGIQEYFARCAMIDGVELPRYQSDPTSWIQAAFSTMSLPGILGNTTTRAMLDGYNYVESAWREIVKIASVKDFKEHTRYRLTGDMKFELVAKDGELKHGTLGEQSFTQKVDTRGILFGLTRQDIINDDMGAFMAIPRLLGMGAAESVAEVLWTLLLANPSSFFHADNSNYAEGAGTALAIDALSQAEQLFLDQTKPNGRPLGIAPKKLLVPTALKVVAEQLMSSLQLIEGASSARTRKLPSNNPHAGKFTPVCSAYLSNSTLTGYSALAWYLFADPNVLAALEVAFLNGVDRPVIEKADADFNTLGVQFRGYMDFGVKEQDPRGAVKMKGEA